MTVWRSFIRNRGGFFINGSIAVVKGGVLTMKGSLKFWDTTGLRSQG